MPFVFWYNGHGDMSIQDRCSVIPANTVVEARMKVQQMGLRGGTLLVPDHEEASVVCDEPRLTSDGNDVGVADSLVLNEPDPRAGWDDYDRPKGLVEARRVDRIHEK